MNSFNHLLNKSAPQELNKFVDSCASEEDLVSKVKEKPFWAISILENMKLEGNESLATRLLYHINTDGLNNPIVKKIETSLRNRGMLNYETDSDFSITKEGKPFLKAHRSILALESPHFMKMMNWGGKDREMGKIVMNDFDSDVYQLARNYLYLSDDKRQGFVSTVDKTLLPQVAALSNLWDIEELKRASDDELCNSLAEIKIEKSDIKSWSDQSLFLPKFSMLAKFINRVAGEGELGPVIEKMQTPEGAAQLAVRCTPEEIEAFATLKTKFGKACRIPQGTFGKKEWESLFPITIEEVPPLPPNIHAILEKPDPWEPDKKLKDTCMLFLRPEKATLHVGDDEKEIALNFAGVEEIAKNATDEKRRVGYRTFQRLRDQMNKLPAAKSGWVLMRKEVITGTRNCSFTKQKQELEGTGFGVPKMMDAILLNILTHAKEGTYLYGQQPWTYTRCQETYGDYQTLVGGFAGSGLGVHYDFFAYDSSALSGSWKF